jgi:predicted alpha/beta superfamily hydrolase
MSRPGPLISAHAGGVLHRYADFVSQHIAPRHVEVWTPPGYAQSTARYPVLYMHDGQNLFNPAEAYIGVTWGVAEAIGQLMAAGLIDGVIVVGIWCTLERRREYMPYQPLIEPVGRRLADRFTRAYGGLPQSDEYLRFIVAELKPFIDEKYRTRAEQPHTFVMGSSLGGLMSLYALCRYPHIFGSAACLSTHWPIGGPLLIDWFGANLPRAGAHRLYFDFGTDTLDAPYAPYQQRMDERLARAGYTAGRDWLTRKFDGAEHSERAWRARVAEPLQFLLHA